MTYSAEQLCRPGLALARWRHFSLDRRVGTDSSNRGGLSVKNKTMFATGVSSLISALELLVERRLPVQMLPLLSSSDSHFMSSRAFGAESETNFGGMLLKR